MRVALFLAVLLFGACAEPPAFVRHPDTTRLEPAVRDAIGEARSDFERAIDANARDAGAYAALGHVYLAHHLNDAAADCLDRAAELATAESAAERDARYLSGVAHAASGRQRLAERSFERVLAIDAGHNYARYRLGNVYLKAGRLQDARTMLHTAARALSNDPAVLSSAGRLALAEGDFQRAGDYFQRALRLQPDATRLFHPLARAARGVGQPAEPWLARAGDGEARERDPRLRDIAALSRSTQMLLEQGQTLIAAKAYDRAADVFTRATEQRPEDVFAWASLGRSLELSGELDRAGRALERAVAIDAASSVAQRFLGMYRERRGDDVGARRAYQAAANADPEDVRARLLLGHAHMRAADWAGAAVEYQVVSERRAGNITARYYLALSHLAAGQCERASEAIESGLALKANFGPLLEAKARHAAVCGAPASELAAAMQMALALEAARPDAASAVTVALVRAARGEHDEARRARERALERARDDAMRGRIVTQLPADGAPAVSAWPVDSPTLRPPRLTAEASSDRLN
ncbi:MAG: tetratricopeptide repeat protein [Pseudomonadota bacterium]